MSPKQLEYSKKIAMAAGKAVEKVAGTVQDREEGEALIHGFFVGAAASLLGTYVKDTTLDKLPDGGDCFKIVADAALAAGLVAMKAVIGKYNVPVKNELPGSILGRKLETMEIKLISATEDLDKLEQVFLHVLQNTLTLNCRVQNVKPCKEGCANGKECMMRKRRLAVISAVAKTFVPLVMQIDTEAYPEAVYDRVLEQVLAAPERCKAAWKERN